MLLFSRLRRVAHRRNRDGRRPEPPPAGARDEVNSDDGPPPASRRGRFLSRMPQILLHRRRDGGQSGKGPVVRGEIGSPISSGGNGGGARIAPGSPGSPGSPDDIGDPMIWFSPVTDHALDGAVSRDDVPDIIGEKIQGHHELWYRLAYGRSRDRRVCGGYALQPATLAGRPLPRRMSLGGATLTQIASWKSRPNSGGEGVASPQGSGHRPISSIDYGNADEVVLTNTQDMEGDLVCAENTLPEGAQRFLIHPYDKRKV